MTSDHYIAETYMKPFCGKDDMLQRYFKKSANVEATRRVPKKSVCCKENWDKNNLLSDPQAVQKFLTLYENRWSESLVKLLSDDYSAEVKEVIAGYIFYMQAMSPLGRERYIGVMTQKIRTTIDLRYDYLSKKLWEDLSKEDQEFIDAYLEIGGSSALDSNEIWCHALVVQMLFKNYPHDIYTSAKWQILKNNTSEPFITSDHPICLLDPEQLITRTFVPLTPKAGLIITPILDNIHKSRTIFEAEGKIYVPTDLDEFKEVNTKHVKALNVHMIKTAKEIILTSEKSTGLKKAVEKFKDWELQYINSQEPTSDGGYIVGTSLRLVNSKKN